MNLVAWAGAAVAIGFAFAVVLWRLRRISHALGSLSQELAQVGDRAGKTQPAPAPTAPDPVSVVVDATAVDEERDARRAAESDLERLVEAHRELQGQLEVSQRDASHDRQALILLMDVAGGSEVLDVCRDAIAALAAKKPVRPQADRASVEPVASDEPDGLADDPAHRKAARIARVLVADLFLYNENRLDQKMTGAQVRACLERQYRGARETFEGRVAPEVRKERDHLEVEYQRALSKRLSGASAKVSLLTPTPKGLAAAADEHADAARMAKLMVAQLLLMNRARVEEGIRNQDLRGALGEEYQAMKKEFEGAVADRVWKKQHHLDDELRRVFEDWDVRHSLDAELNQLFTERFD